MEVKMQRFPMSEIKSEWGKPFNPFKVGMETYNVFASGNDGVTHFLYVPPKNGEPLAQNVTIGYRFNEWHRIRCGKRYIKIKRFGKTRRYYVSKFMMTRGRILNDKWIHNLRTPL